MRKQRKIVVLGLIVALSMVALACSPIDFGDLSVESRNHRSRRAPAGEARD